MKVTIEFDLDFEKENYQDAMDGSKWKYVIRELDEHMRGTLKWNGENMSDAQLKVVQEIRDMLVEYMEQENLKLHA